MIDPFYLGSDKGPLWNKVVFLYFWLNSVYWLSLESISHLNHILWPRWLYGQLNEEMSWVLTRIAGRIHWFHVQRTKEWFTHSKSLLAVHCKEDPRQRRDWLARLQVNDGDQELSWSMAKEEFCWLNSEKFKGESIAKLETNCCKDEEDQRLRMILLQINNDELFRWEN